MEFKNYLIIENQVLFSQRLGDIMNSIQDLTQDPVALGKDKKAKEIVNQIRARLLRTKWNSKLGANLKTLQNCAANISMSLDPKRENRPDLNSVLSSCLSTLKQMSSKLDAPINNIGSPE
jgi:hypothetical protein